MDDEEIISTLEALLKKETLNSKEKEAVLASVGFLTLANKVSKSAIAKLKQKRSHTHKILTNHPSAPSNLDRSD